jgi:hypothetical protein
LQEDICFGEEPYVAKAGVAAAQESERKKAIKNEFKRMLEYRVREIYCLAPPSFFLFSGE